MRQVDETNFQSLYRKEKGNKPDQEELFFLSFLNSKISITNSENWQTRLKKEQQEKEERDKKSKLKAKKGKQKKREEEKPQEPFVILMFDTLIEQLNRMPFYVETNFQAVLDKCRLMKNSEQLGALRVQIQNIASEQQWQKKRFLQSIEKPEIYELFHDRILKNTPLSRAETIFFKVLCVSNMIDRFVLPLGSINKSDEFAKKQLADLSSGRQLKPSQFLRVIRYAEYLAVLLLESSKQDDREKIATHLFVFIRLIKELKATFLKQGSAGDIEKNCYELNQVIALLNKKNKIYNCVNLQGISKSGIYKGRKLLEEAKIIFAQKLLNINNGELINYTGTLRQWMYLQTKPTQESVVSDAALLVRQSRDDLLQCNDTEGEEYLRQIFCYRYQLFSADYGEMNISETIKNCYQENKKKLLKAKQVKSSIKKQENTEWARHKSRLKKLKKVYLPTLSPMALASQCWMLNHYTVLRDNCKSHLTQKVREARQSQETYSDTLALISSQELIGNVANMKSDVINSICFYLDQMMVNASTQMRIPAENVNSQGFNLSASFSKNCPYEKKMIAGLIDQDNQYSDSVLGAFFHFLFNEFEHLSVNEKNMINETLERKSKELGYLLPFQFKLGFDEEVQKTYCYYRRETGRWEKFSGDQRDIITKLAELNQAYFQIKDSINVLKDFFSDAESLHYDKQLTASEQRSLEKAVKLLEKFDTLKNSISSRTVAYNRICVQAVNNLKDWFDTTVLRVIRNETSSCDNVIAKHIVGSTAYPYISKMAKAFQQEKKLKQAITKVNIKDYLERIYDESFFRQGWGADADLLIHHLEFYRDYAADDVSRLNKKSENRYDKLTEKQALDYLVDLASAKVILKKDDAAAFETYLDAVAVIIQSNDENTIRRWANDHLFQEVFFHVFEAEDDSFLTLLAKIDDLDKRQGLFEQKKSEISDIHKNMLLVCQAFLDESPYFINQQNRLSARFKTPFENNIKQHRYEDILFYLNRLLDKDYESDKLNVAIQQYVNNYDGNDIRSYCSIMISWYEKTKLTVEQKNKLISDYIIKRINHLIHNEALGTVNYQPEHEPIFTWLASMQDQNTQSEILDLLGDGLIQLAQLKRFSLENYGVLSRCVDVGFLANDGFLYKGISEKLSHYFYRRKDEIGQRGSGTKLALKRALIVKKLAERDKLKKDKKRLKRYQKEQIKEKLTSIGATEKELDELELSYIGLKKSVLRNNELYSVIDSQLTQLASIASHEVAADSFYEKTFLYVDKETAAYKLQNWADEIPPKARRNSQDYIKKLITNCIEKDFLLPRCPASVNDLPGDLSQAHNVPPSLSEQRLTLLIENCIDNSALSIDEIILLLTQINEKKHKSNQVFSPVLYCLVNKLLKRAIDEMNIDEDEKGFSDANRAQLENILSELNKQFFYYYLDKPKRFTSDWLHYPESLYQCISFWQNDVIANPLHREPLINACLPPNSNSHYDFDRFVYSLNSKIKPHCKNGFISMFGHLARKFEQTLHAYARVNNKLSQQKLAPVLQGKKASNKLNVYKDCYLQTDMQDSEGLLKLYQDKLISVSKGGSEDNELSGFSDLTIQLVKEIESIWFSSEGVIGEKNTRLITLLFEIIRLKKEGTFRFNYNGQSRVESIFNTATAALNKRDSANQHAKQLNLSDEQQADYQAKAIKSQIEADGNLVEFKNEMRELFLSKADEINKLNFIGNDLVALFKNNLAVSRTSDSEEKTIFDFSFNEILELLRVVSTDSAQAKELIDNLDNELAARKAGLSDNACQLEMLNWWRNIILQVSGWDCRDNLETGMSEYQYSKDNRSSSYTHRLHDLHSRYADYAKLQVDSIESFDLLNKAIVELSKLEFNGKPKLEYSLQKFDHYFNSRSSKERCQILYGYAQSVVKKTQTGLILQYSQKSSYYESVDDFNADRPQIDNLSAAVAYLEKDWVQDKDKSIFLNKLQFIQHIYSKFSDKEQCALDDMSIFKDFKNIKPIQASLQAAHKAKRKTTVQKESGLASLIKEADNLNKFWPDCKDALAKLMLDTFKLINNSEARHQSAFFVDLINSIYANFPSGAHEMLVFQRFVLEQLYSNHNEQEIRAFFNAFVSPCKISDSNFKDFLAQGDLLRDCSAVDLKVKLQRYISELSPQADSFFVLAELERVYYSQLRGEHFSDKEVILDINAVLEKHRRCKNNSKHLDNVLIQYMYNFLMNEPIPKERLDYLSDKPTTSTSLSSYLSGDEGRYDVLFSSSSDTDLDSDSASSSGSSNPLPVVSKPEVQKEKSWLAGLFSSPAKVAMPEPIKTDLLTNLACLRQSKIVNYFIEPGAATSASLMIDSLQPIMSEAIKTYMLSNKTDDSKALLQELFSVVDMFDGGRSLASSRALLSSCLLNFVYLSASSKKRHERVHFFNQLVSKLNPALQAVMPKLFFDHFVAEFYKDEAVPSLAAFALTKEKISQLILKQKERLPNIKQFITDYKNYELINTTMLKTFQAFIQNINDTIESSPSNGESLAEFQSRSVISILKAFFKLQTYLKIAHKDYRYSDEFYEMYKEMLPHFNFMQSLYDDVFSFGCCATSEELSRKLVTLSATPLPEYVDIDLPGSASSDSLDLKDSQGEIEKNKVGFFQFDKPSATPRNNYIGEHRR